MRHRTTLLFLLACLLAAGPYLQSNREQQLCAERTSQHAHTIQHLLDGFDESISTCPDVLPPPAWARAMGLLAVFVLLAAGVSFTLALRDRHRERQLLAAIGVRVDEADLPLDD